MSINLLIFISSTFTSLNMISVSISFSSAYEHRPIHPIVLAALSIGYQAHIVLPLDAHRVGLHLEKHLLEGQLEVNGNKWDRRAPQDQKSIEKKKKYVDECQSKCNVDYL